MPFLSSLKRFLCWQQAIQRPKNKCKLVIHNSIKSRNKHELLLFEAAGGCRGCCAGVGVLDGALCLTGSWGGRSLFSAGIPCSASTITTQSRTQRRARHKAHMLVRCSPWANTPLPGLGCCNWLWVQRWPALARNPSTWSLRRGSHRLDLSLWKR